MSRKPRPTTAPAPAAVFAALGDETRLRLVDTLCRGEPRSISALAGGFDLTRQAVTKHLRVLQSIGLVRSERQGREIVFEFIPGPVESARSYLDDVAHRWSDALDRLKRLVESDR